MGDALRTTSSYLSLSRLERRSAQAVAEAERVDVNSGATRVPPGSTEHLHSKCGQTDSWERIRREVTPSGSPTMSGRIRPDSCSGTHMKRYVIAIGLMLLAASSTFAREQTLLARVTVYWASGGGGSDHWTRKHQSATSVRLRAGHCAVDPRRIPYGSKVVLPDVTLTAVDTGSHVVSRRAARRAGRSTVERNALVVDRFFETKRQALSWARAHPHFMPVRVLAPNYRREPQPLSRVAVTPTKRPQPLSQVVVAPSKPMLLASRPPRIPRSGTSDPRAPVPRYAATR